MVVWEVTGVFVRRIGLPESCVGCREERSLEEALKWKNYEREQDLQTLRSAETAAILSPVGSNLQAIISPCSPTTDQSSVPVSFPRTDERPTHPMCPTQTDDGSDKSTSPLYGSDQLVLRSGSSRGSDGHQGLVAVRIFILYPSAFEESG